LLAHAQAHVSLTSSSSRRLFRIFRKTVATVTTRLNSAARSSVRRRPLESPQTVICLLIHRPSPPRPPSGFSPSSSGCAAAAELGGPVLLLCVCVRLFARVFCHSVFQCRGEHGPHPKRRRSCLYSSETLQEADRRSAQTVGKRAVETLT
jgi:hypothetical protein